MGRPIKYLNENDRKEAIKQSKTRYMLSKSWICPVCNHDYKLAGKHSHMSTKKHITNSILKGLENDDKFDVILAE